MALYPDDQQPQAPQPVPPPTQTPQTASAAPRVDDSYGLPHAIVDALSQKLGFGTPIRNVESMRLAREENARRGQVAQQAMTAQQQALDRDRQAKLVADVARDTAGYFLAVGKPTSGYYKDLNHLASGFNKSEPVKQFMGGELVVNRTGRTAATGDEIWSVGIKDSTGQVRPQFEDTTPNAMSRFEAQLHPEVRKAIYAGIEGKHAADQETIDKLKNYASADLKTKQALGLPVTAVDRYQDIKQSFPELDDWQAREASGLKVDGRYKILSHTPIAMSGDRVGLMAEDRKEPGKIVTVEIPGMKLSDYKKSTKDTLEKLTNMHWPTSAETPEHEVRGKGVFAAHFDAEQDPSKQRWMYTEVLPAFRDWLERQSGEVEETDAKGKVGTRRLTTGEMNGELRRLMKQLGAGAGGGASSDPKGTTAAKVADDKGSWSAYLAEPPGKPAAGGAPSVASVAAGRAPTTTPAPVAERSEARSVTEKMGPEELRAYEARVGSENWEKLKSFIENATGGHRATGDADWEQTLAQENAAIRAGWSKLVDSLRDRGGQHPLTPAERARLKQMGIAR